jgi:kynureninase
MTRQECHARDAADPLAPLRAQFVIPEGVVYLDGNSLGPPVRASATRAAAFVTDQWGAHLIGGWERDGWIASGARLGARIAPLIGARPREVMVCDSTTVNLFKLLHVAVSLRSDRPVLLASDDDFPTDRYLVEAVATQRGCTVRWAPPHQWHGPTLDGVAVGVLSHVNFRSGRINDMAAITRALHDAGALALWDLSHSVGALPVDLGACQVDMAVGCTYKFLCGGPGAPAFAMVAEHLDGEARTPIPGWLGHATPFAFADSYAPAPGTGWLVTGTPGIASHVMLDTALDVVAVVDMDASRRKAVELGVRFLDVVERELPGVFTLHSPPEPELRGNHVSLGHPDGFAIVQALIACGVVGDFREPDVLRFGFAPLYLSYMEVHDAAMALVEVMRTEEWRDPRFSVRGSVT